MNILALPAALAFTMNLTLCLIVLSSPPKDVAHLRVIGGDKNEFFWGNRVVSDAHAPGWIWWWFGSGDS